MNPLAASFFFAIFYFLFLFFRDKVISVNGEDYSEKYRLKFHYSVPSGWLNDPNGLVWHNGYYHMFYQHYPENAKWGPMHWGHARSQDLIHWENLPIALKPFEKGMIFSGCCLNDEDNVTGLVQGSPSDTLLAIYTLASDEHQTQAMAYSNDNGM